MRALLLSLHDVDFADSRYRVYQYLPALRAAGIEARVEPLVSRELARLYWTGGLEVRARRAWLGAAALLARVRLALEAPRWDVALVQRELYPFGPPLLEALAAGRGARLAFDFDDAIWLRGEGARARDGLRDWLRNPAKAARIVRLSRVAIAGNAYLAAWARRRLPPGRVHTIPTVIDTERYPVKRHAARRPVAIGWVGSPSTAAYLEPLQPVLARLAARDDVRIVIVGAPGFRPRGYAAEVRPWRLDRELDDLLDLDIGLMPQPDNAWTRGKCAFKAIQYMGVGVPAVCSPVGVANELIAPGENGYLAATPEAWAAHLTRLVEDPALRARLGAAARATIEARWSLAVWAPRFVAALRAAAG